MSTILTTSNYSVIVKDVQKNVLVEPHPVCLTRIRQSIGVSNVTYEYLPPDVSVTCTSTYIMVLCRK